MYHPEYRTSRTVVLFTPQARRRIQAKSTSPSIRLTRVWADSLTEKSPAGARSSASRQKRQSCALPADREREKVQATLNSSAPVLGTEAGRSCRYNLRQTQPHLAWKRREILACVTYTVQSIETCAMRGSVASRTEALPDSERDI